MFHLLWCNFQCSFTSYPGFVFLHCLLQPCECTSSDDIHHAVLLVVLKAELPRFSAGNTYVGRPATTVTTTNIHIYLGYMDAYMRPAHRSHARLRAWCMFCWNFEHEVEGCCDLGYRTTLAPECRY